MSENSCNLELVKYDAETENFYREKELRDLVRAGFPRSAVYCEKRTNPECEKAFELIEKCLQQSGSVIVLSGPPGTGKSTLATRAAAKQKTSVHCEAAAWIFARIRSCNQPASAETEIHVMQQYQSFNLLVIEEVGFRKNTDFERQTLGLLICKRYDAGKHTILISAEAGDVTEFLDPAIISRMNESGGRINCKWPSMR